MRQIYPTQRRVILFTGFPIQIRQNLLMEYLQYRQGLLTQSAKMFHHRLAMHLP